jgi:hypothetical protein
MKFLKLILSSVICFVLVESRNTRRRKEARGYQETCEPSKIMDTWFGQCKSGLKCDEERKICLVGPYHNCADMSDKNHNLLSSRTLECVNGHTCLYKSKEWTEGDPKWACIKNK